MDLGEDYWLLINVIILIVGFCFGCYGKYIDSSENVEALMYLLIGVVVFVGGVLSELVRHFFTG